MLQSHLKRGVVFVVCILACAFLIVYPRATSTQGAGRTDEQEQNVTPPAEQTAEQKYKNIQALKGLPAAQVRPMMNYFATTMGWTCAGCHVKNGDQWEFEKDDNNHKKIARKMILMTMELNKQHFNGRVQVTCMTCHQGHDHPISVPAFPVTPPKEESRPTTPFPTPKDILAKYAQAVGGKEALEKIQTRVMKGSSVAANGQSFPLEISFAAPNRFMLSVALPQGATTQRFNGSTGWLKNAREDREMDAVEIARAKSLAMSLDPMLLFRDPNLRLSFGGFDKIGDREVQTLRLGLPDKRRVRFFFDKESGLLLRRIITTETPVSLDPEQTDYEDYREVDGIKVPFTIRTSYLDRFYSSLRKFTEVKHNAKVDDAQFAMPAGK